MKKNFYICDLAINNDSRGTLTSFQADKNCPFEIKRAFYIKDVPDRNIIRGNHINNHTSMLIVALQGECTIACEDNYSSEVFHLNSPTKALIINKGVYRKLYNFSSDAILLCLCDNYYDSSEYRK